MFHPTYTFKAACFGPLAKVNAKRSVKGRDVSLMGKEQGSAVDREVTAIARLLAKHRVGAAMYADRSKRLPRTLPRRAFDALSGYRATQHVYTQKVFDELARQKWEPIAAQVACGSVDARLGTAVDIVCVDPRRPDKDILLELKCGFARYIDRFSTRMKAPFQAMTDSPRNQFQLQLMFSRILYARTFVGRTVGHCAIIRVHETGVSIDLLRQDVVKLGAAAWRLLVASSSLRSGVALTTADVAKVVHEHKQAKVSRKREHEAAHAESKQLRVQRRKLDLPHIKCVREDVSHLVHRRVTSKFAVSGRIPVRTFAGYSLAN